MAQNNNDSLNTTYPSYSSRMPVSVGASPFVLTNTTGVRMDFLMSLGTVSLVEFSRDQSTWDNCGLLAGQFRLNPADSLRITYLVPPTIVAYPF